MEAATGKPVEHVVEREEARPDGVRVGRRRPRARATTIITGRPPANQSSRVEAQFLGMLLFIISEIMLFGAFFTAYFFIRVVDDAAGPLDGNELPVAIAGVNTAILVSSSFTMHWALEGARNENRARDADRPAHHRCCSA